MFPNELKRLPNWVGYRVITREGRETKVPMSPINGGFAESNNRVTWGTYEQAVESAERNKWAGIGFMFEPPYIGIDLDDCVVDGVINDFARDVIRAANTYTEFSPSGTGVHMIGKGRLDRALKKKEIEVYQTGRYFTVTRKVVQPVRMLRELNLAFLDKFYDREIGSQRAIAKISTVQNGTRNNDMFSMASSLRARGCEPQEIYAFLEPKAKELEFPLEELTGICSRMVRYPKGSMPGVHNESQGESVESFLEDQEPVKWICKPFIAEQSIGIIGGLPESRKSWIMVDLAIECARGGGLWLNKFPVKGAKVLLVDQERSKAEVQRRLKAVIAGKGLSVADIASQLFVRSGTTSRINLEPSFLALKKELAEIKPDLLLIDSFATIHTLNESSRADIQQVMERLKEIRNEFKCSVVLIHHESKASYQNKRDGAEPSYLDLAGNVAIPAAAEVVISVVKHDAESSFVHHTKSTQGSKAPPFMVKVTDEKPDGSEILVQGF